MICPPDIRPGDLIGIVSPAKRIDKAIIANAVKMIEASGYRVRLGENVFASGRYFAGTDLERASDFQKMLDDPDVKMILCSRGGYGSARIIDKFDFSHFRKHPKWIAGYSDITVFHSHLFNLGFESLHCTMPLDFPDSGDLSEPIQKIFRTASGLPMEYRHGKSAWNRTGTAEGLLVGGNLSVWAGLSGSASDIDTSGKILFLEDVGEELYRIDRMMVSLKRAGKFENLSALLLGGFTGIDSVSSDFDFSLEEIILDAVSQHDIPVAFGFPAGHFPENYPLVIGRKMKMEVGEDTTLKEIR